ncbi:MAG: sigma 54-interacting transcriptional regulator [Oscillospiraceae bacterium]
MSKIAFFVPYHAMIQQIRDAWAISEQYTLETSLYTNHKFEYSIRDNPDSNDKIEDCDGADVLVARGATAILLKQYFLNSDVHVVEIPLTSADLISTIRHALKRYGNLPIAVAGTYNMTYGAQGILKSNRYNIRVYQSREASYNSYEDTVRRAARDGCKIIIGGVHTTAYARELGLFGDLLTTSVVSILHAISAAKSAAVIVEKERRRSTLYHAIISNTYSGIISYDQDNEIIWINDSALILLGQESAPTSPKRLNELLSPGQLLQMLIRPEIFQNRIVEYKGKTLVVSKALIPYGEEKNCYLTTFQNAAALVQYINDYDAKNKSLSAAYIAENSFNNIIGTNQRLISTIKTAKHYAEMGKNILITGEPGTGKSLFAQSIHNGGGHRRGLFLTIECSSLTREKLFGTQAHDKSQPGIFELASNGTLLLREVDRLQKGLQGDLISAISSHSVTRLGSGFTIPLDLNIISTTSCDLEVLSNSGQFEPRLYYLLSTLILDLPPLRERPEDVMPLIEHYLRLKLGKEPPGFRPGAAALLQTYKWHGNMYELLCCCDRLSTLGSVRQYSESNILDMVINAPVTELSGTGIESRIEKHHILEILADCNFNRTRAAKKLGMSRTTLWRKLNKYGIRD